MKPGYLWFTFLVVVTALFLFFEIPTILDPVRGDTLSENVAAIWIPFTVFLSWLIYHFACEMAPPGTVRRRAAVLPGWASAVWGIGSGIACLVFAGIVWL